MKDDKQVLPLAIGKRRRHYSPALKQEMVAATLSGAESVSQVARRYDINANLLFRWRKLHQEGLLQAVPATQALLPVEVTDHPATVTASLEVHLKRARLIIQGGVDPSTLRTVLELLR